MESAYTVTTGSFLLAIFILYSAASAADPDMLQDVCVARLNSSMLMPNYSAAVKVKGFPCASAKENGFPCKASFNASDFFSKVLAKPGPTNNTLKATVTEANVLKIPGLNTLGISLSRIDYAPGGENPPHIHPRASEIIFVLEGWLIVGFITTDDKLITKPVKMGDVFVFPRGLVHFQKNDGCEPAVVIAAFDSQLPGTQYVANTLFNATPPVQDNVLAVAFQIDTDEVQKIKAGLATTK